MPCFIPVFQGRVRSVVVYSIRASGQPVLTYQHIRISYQSNLVFGIAGYISALTGSSICGILNGSRGISPHAQDRNPDESGDPK